VTSVEIASFVPIFESSDGGLPRDVTDYFRSFDVVVAYVSDPDKILARNLAKLGMARFFVNPPFPLAEARVHVSKYLLDTIESLLGDIESLLGDAGEQQPITNRPPLFLTINEDEMRWAKSFLQFKSPLPHFTKGGLGDCPANPFLYDDPHSSRRGDPAGRPNKELRNGFLGGILPGGRPVIAIHPGSGSETKCWPVERFEALARELKRETDCSIVMILGPADERLVERMRALTKELHSPIAHSLPLRSLAAALANCALYVGNDSGVTHLAAAVGVPTVAIFGPTDPIMWAPNGDNVKIVQGDIECSPCKSDKMRQCIDRKCLTVISVDEVARAAERFLSCL
jgi:hypothetical protein